MTLKNRKQPARHPTIHIASVTVLGPDTGGQVEVEIRKDQVTGAMVGIDGSYLEQDVGPVRDPYNPNTILVIPDDEPAGTRKASGP